MAAYLRHKGWEEEPYLDDKAAKWTGKAPDDSKIVILQPLVRTFADYASRMVDLLKALSAAEGRGQNAVYSDILTVNTDVIRGTCLTDDAVSGSVSLEDGTRVVAAAKNMLLRSLLGDAGPEPGAVRGLGSGLDRAHRGRGVCGGSAESVLATTPATGGDGLFAQDAAGSDRAW